ncbi:MAG: hypothetical protein JNJ98_19110 [Gemmatimonadetes bacterium]|nr:hypothetical protein [Gemmatimonadota bacterium]
MLPASPQRIRNVRPGIGRRVAWMFLAATALRAQDGTSSSPSLALTPATRLEQVNTRAQWVTYRGMQALHLAPLPGQEQATDQEMWAVITGSQFTDGIIEVDVAGARRAGYATDNASAFKGFVGISFRVRGDSAERFYVRPENARLDDQLFRNRTTQYEAPPQAPWQLLRRDTPGVYESYADMEPGAWTHLRIVVRGHTARLYVNGAMQPALVVTDLKHGTSRGAIALWTRISADAYFANLRVSPLPVTPDRAGAASAPPVIAPVAGPLPAIRDVVNGRVVSTTFRGRPALHLIVDPAKARTDEAIYALIDGPPFVDGRIDLTLAGRPRADAPADSRGFVGISFRTGPHAEWSEVFYLRPLNARVDDQLRRNRTLQYASDPAFPWHLLREESPGVYESYADIEPDTWIALRIEVDGTRARLFVNGASQPSLVVNDLKHGTSGGQVALWAHVETDAYFGPVKITPPAASRP